MHNRTLEKALEMPKKKHAQYIRCRSIEVTQRRGAFDEEDSHIVIVLRGAYAQYAFISVNVILWIQYNISGERE